MSTTTREGATRSHDRLVLQLFEWRLDWRYLTKHLDDHDCFVYLKSPIYAIFT